MESSRTRRDVPALSALQQGALALLEAPQQGVRNAARIHQNPVAMSQQEVKSICKENRAMYYPPQQFMSDFGLPSQQPPIPMVVYFRRSRVLFLYAYFCRATSIAWDPFLVSFASQSSSCRFLYLCRHCSSLSAAAYDVDFSRACSAPARSGHH